MNSKKEIAYLLKRVILIQTLHKIMVTFVIILNGISIKSHFIWLTWTEFYCNVGVILINILVI